MKKRILILLAVLMYAVFPAFAEDTQNPEKAWQDSQQGPQGGPGMMMGRGQGMGMGMGKGMGMMGGMMQKDTVVATSDGGVVIMQGPRLLKYDKDLTLVKEVELPRGKKPGPEQGGQEEPGMPPQGQPQ